MRHAPRPPPPQARAASNGVRNLAHGARVRLAARGTQYAAHMNTSQARSAKGGPAGVDVANFHQLTLDVADHQTAHQDLSGRAARRARADSCRHSKECHAGWQFVGGLVLVAVWSPFGAREAGNAWTHGRGQFPGDWSQTWRPGNLNGPSLYYRIANPFASSCHYVSRSSTPDFSSLSVCRAGRVGHVLVKTDPTISSEARPVCGWMNAPLPPATPPIKGGDEENCYFEKTPDAHLHAGAAAWHGHIDTPCGCCW